MEKPSQASEGDSEPVRLLDLAHGWLAWLALAVEKEASLQALSSTCHKLHDLVFNQSAVVPKLRIQTIKKLGSHLHVRALALAEAATSNLHVELNAACGDPNLLRTRWVATCTRAATLHALSAEVPQQAPVQVPYQLRSITRLTLAGSYYDVDAGAFHVPDDAEADKHLNLDSLIPDFLVQGCPNLRELTLDRVTIAASPSASEPRTCSSLQKLTLKLALYSGGAPSPAVRQQLLNLPSLTSLSITQRQKAYTEAREMLRAACDKYSSQLQSIEEIYLSVLCSFSQPPWSPGTRLPRLQHLAMTRTSVTSDAALQRLMQAAPKLVSLHVRCIEGLKASFAQEPCTWRELTIGDVQVDQLAQLPLSHCTRVTCFEGISVYCPEDSKPTPEQVAAGVAAVQAVGGLQFSDDVHIKARPHDVQLIPAAGPLLKQISGVADILIRGSEARPFPPWSECQSVIAALGQYLGCWMLTILTDWSDKPGVFALLPKLLPHVKGFDCYRVPEAEVLKCCHAATLPFTLHLSAGQAGMKPKLERAMREAGHKLVTIEVDR